MFIIFLSLNNIYTGERPRAGQGVPERLRQGTLGAPLLHGELDRVHDGIQLRSPIYTVHTYHMYVYI